MINFFLSYLGRHASCGTYQIKPTLCHLLVSFFLNKYMYLQYQNVWESKLEEEKTIFKTISVKQHPNFLKIF